MPEGSPYSADRYPHWIHVWVKDLKGLSECGPSTYGRATGPAIPATDIVPFPICCGLKLRWSTEVLKSNPYEPTTNQNKYLALCQIPASEKFPAKLGWRRFALYKDYKWGINFDSPHVHGAQKCPHVFDLAKIEAWEMAQPLPPLR